MGPCPTHNGGLAAMMCRALWVDGAPEEGRGTPARSVGRAAAAAAGVARRRLLLSSAALQRPAITCAVMSGWGGGDGAQGRGGGVGSSLAGGWGPGIGINTPEHGNTRCRAGAEMQNPALPALHLA